MQLHEKMGGRPACRRLPRHARPSASGVIPPILATSTCTIEHAPLGPYIRGSAGSSTSTADREIGVVVAWQSLDVAVAIIGGQRLLDPSEIEVGEAPRAADRLVERAKP